MILIIAVILLNNILPSLEDTVDINEWYCLGPFSVGMREGIIGIDENIETETYTPELSRFYPTTLAQGGKVIWQKINPDSGILKIKYQDVLWDTIQDIYGFVGLLNAGYAWAEFNCDGAKRALVRAMGVSSFILNNKVFPGDVYEDGYFLVPVILKNGKNHVLLKLSGYGDHEVNFKIMPSPNPIRLVSKDVLLPDFITGEKITSYIGVPVMNASEQRLYDIVVNITGDLIKPVNKRIATIMPLSCSKIPIMIETEKIISGDDSTALEIKVESNDISVSEKLWIKIKKPGDAYARTFISSIDNSCQYYAVLPPKDYHKDSAYALIMTCHGAGVEARGQVGAYTQKNWAFVVAPTNRRRYGFDWQDWGRLDFLEVLEEVKKNYKIDENRVYLTGHSMGGHGVWHIGLSHPDLFAAIAPSAGWTTIQLYAPFFLQKSYLFAEPEQIKYRDMVMREDVTPVFLENAMNLPIYILHGGSDDNVPAMQARLMNNYLSKWHKNYIYNEVPGMGHWWNYDSTPGIDCVDLKEMMEFLKDKERNRYPKKITLKMSSTQQNKKCYWIEINELENVKQDGSLEISIKDNFMRAHTQNIKKFSIFIDTLLHGYKSAFIIVDHYGMPFKLEQVTRISFEKTNGTFKIVKQDKKKIKAAEPSYGPIKRAFFSPFILVYGTTGDQTSTENSLHLARSYAYTWWMRANGFVEVIPDTEVTEEITENYNIILFGNNTTNSYVKYINYKLPIYIEDYQFRMGIDQIDGKDLHFRIDEEWIDADDLCMMEIYPNPLNKEKFVLLYSAASSEAEKYLSLFPVLYSGSGLPDFIIWDRSAARFGWAGVVACGFFDNSWRLNEKLMFIKK